MRIEVLYRTHRYESFDPTTQVAAEPFRSGGTNVMTDWNLYLDQMETQGIILAEHYYAPGAGTATIDGVQVPVANRQPGCVMLLVDPKDLADLVWLKKDGEKLLWREGDDLINGERFFAMEQLCYSDETIKSVNARAVAVFDYLKHANPEEDDNTLAQQMGYTAQAIERIRQAEFAQRQNEDTLNPQEEGEDETDPEDLADEADPDSQDSNIERERWES